MAAAVATRHLLTSALPSTDFRGRDDIHSLLLPRLCLNRYYLAEGVRIYCQETWRLVTMAEEGGGRRVVEKHLDHVVAYYIGTVLK